MEYEKVLAMQNAANETVKIPDLQAAAPITSIENETISLPDEEKPEMQSDEAPAEPPENESSGEKQKNTQSDAMNSEFARRRREEKRQNELKKAHESGIINALGGVNPYTKEKMSDSSDVEEFLYMKKIADSGIDPLGEFVNFRKEELRKKSEEATKNEWYHNDAVDFGEKNPGVDIKVLIDDKSFCRFAKGKVGSVPLSEIYSDYLELSDELNEKAGKIAAQTLANRMASPGSLTSENSVSSSFFTSEQIDRMSQQEVLDNYEKIRESMKKWKS